MITRAHMRRQLYRSGGITNARQGYGIGSWVKEKVRKLIPNELADIAVKAAPFVAPFNPGIAAAMRGVGRFDKRGSISDALKQGLLTTAAGAGARYLGGADPMGGGLRGGFTKPYGADSPIARMYEGLRPPVSKATVAQDPTNMIPQISGGADQGPLSKFLYGSTEGGKGLIGAGGEFGLKKSFGKGLPAVMAGSTLASLAVQAAMGDLKRDPGESLTEFNKKRKGTVGKYLDFYFRRANKFRIAPEDMDKAAADFVAQNTKEYVSSGQFNQGGRVGYAAGTPEDFSSWLEGKQKFDVERSREELYREYLEDKRRQKVQEQKTMAAQGGLMRPGYAIGSPEKQMEAGAPPIIYEGNMDPNQQAGLPSIPGPVQMAEDGPEYDMSERGGFQPLGAQEGKDDVKANLAKNEFVFTADAVRAAGGGSIEKGAQKMYDTMKKLESRVA